MQRKPDNESPSSVDSQEKIGTVDMRLRARPARDHDSISKFRTNLEDIVEKPTNLENTKLLVDLWECFEQVQYTIINYPDFNAWFSKLYACTCRAVLNGHLSPNNLGVLNGQLRVRLDKLAKSFQTTNYQEFGTYCHQLVCLLNCTNPWELDYILVFQYKLIATEDEATTLWKKENEILIRMRIEAILIIANQESKRGNYSFKWNPLPFVHAVYLMKSKESGGQKDQNCTFVNIYYLLLCRQLSHSSENDKSSDLMKLLDINEALNVIKRLKTGDYKEQIHGKWKKWKSAPKTIISQVVNCIFQMNQEKRLDSRIVNKAFIYWIKHACDVTDKTDGYLTEVKNLILSKISNMDTDYFYVLADVIWDNYSKLQLKPKLRDHTVVFISVMAMNADYNKISKQDDSRFESIEEEGCSNEMKQKYKKLSKRYLKLADRFMKHDAEIFFHLCLTAFSLNPSSSVYSKVIGEHTSRSSKSGCTNDTENGIQNLDPESKLFFDMWSTLLNCRLGELKLFEQNTDIEKAQELCFEILKTGGPKIKSKSDLHHLQTDFSKYAPPQCDLGIEQEDSAFEKGYEPVPPSSEQNNKKKSRKRSKSSSANDDSIETSANDFIDPALNIEDNNTLPFDCNNNDGNSTPKMTINKRFFSKDEAKSEIFQPTILIKRIRIANYPEPDTENDVGQPKGEDFKKCLPVEFVFLLLPAAKVSSELIDMLELSDGELDEELCDEKLAIITKEMTDKLACSLRQPKPEQAPSSLSSKESSTLSSGEQIKVAKTYNLRKNKKLQKMHLSTENKNREPLKELSNEHNLNQANQMSGTFELLGKRKRQSSRFTSKVQKIT